MSLRMLSVAPAQFRLWVSAWRREDHALYWHTGSGRGLCRWDGPVAGAETDRTDATEDADCKCTNAFTHTCNHAHSHWAIKKTEKKKGWNKGDSFVSPPPHSPVSHTHTFTHTVFFESGVSSEEKLKGSLNRSRMHFCVSEHFTGHTDSKTDGSHWVTEVERLLPKTEAQRIRKNQRERMSVVHLYTCM